jgi:hypothetical protein
MAAQTQQELAKAGTIAGFYQRDPQRVVPALSEGWPAFAVTDRRDPRKPLMAVRVRPGIPPRARALDSTGGDTPVPNVLMPVADGPGLDLNGQHGWFIISPAPPGQSIGLAAGPWREQELISCVLLPAAGALEGLRERGLTHRSIRPDNMFRAAAGQPVTLGPFWQAPPGTGQPPVADPPFLGWCRPACQGDGTIADDVFALGVTLLALAIGKWPLAGVDAQEIVRRSLAQGSFATLTAGHTTLSSYLGDLLRGMLADDPDHRPSPALLLDPLRAAARRTTTRPPRRAQRALEVGTGAAWTARELAYALATQPDAAGTLLRNGAVDRWLRRSLNDPALAGKLEENYARLVAGAGAAGAAGGGVIAPMLLMRAIAIIEPLAPIVWRGEALWPDGLGPAMAMADAPTAAMLREIVEEDVLTGWISNHPRRTDATAMHQLARDWSGWLGTRGASGGINRLLYGLNPLLSCASPLLGGRPVLRLAELLPALEAAAAKADRRQPPIDGHIVAFIAARAEQGMKAELSGLNGFTAEQERPLVLRLFSRLQTRLDCGPLPGLAAWLHESGYTGIDRWRSRTTRAALDKRVAALVAAGQLGPLLAAAEDATAFAADAAGAAAAAVRMDALKKRLADSEKHAPQRLVEARRLAHDIAAGAGLLALMGATLKLAFH